LAIQCLNTPLTAPTYIESKWCSRNGSTTSTIIISYSIWKNDTGIYKFLIEITKSHQDNFISLLKSGFFRVIFFQSFRGAPQGVNLSLINGGINGGVDTLRQVEAKYPALLFKQQLTAYVEKIYGMIRDNLKKEISPLLGLCIQVYFLCNYASTNMFKLFFCKFLR
jgi:hypothetical protein